MPTPTMAILANHTELTTDRPNGPFLAHARRMDGNMLRITSPVVVEAQMVPPRCRKPRVVQLFARITAGIAVDPDRIKTVMTWAEPERLDDGGRNPAVINGHNQKHHVAVNTVNGRFYTTPQAIGSGYEVPGPLGETTANTTLDDHNVAEYRTQWPHDRSHTLTWSAAPTIIHPQYLDNGALNPLAYSASNAGGRSGSHWMDDVEPTATYPSRDEYGRDVDIPYFTSIDDIAHAFGQAIEDQSHSLVYLDDQINLSITAPEIRYAHHNNPGALRLLRPGAKDPRQEPNGFTTTAPISPLDPLVAARRGYTAGDGADYLSHDGLQEAYGELAERFRKRQAALIKQITDPNPAEYRYHIPSDDPDPVSLAEAVSDYSWTSTLDAQAKELALIAETMRRMEKDYPDLPRMQ